MNPYESSSDAPESPNRYGVLVKFLFPSIFTLVICGLILLGLLELSRSNPHRSSKIHWDQPRAPNNANDRRANCRRTSDKFISRSREAFSIVTFKGNA